MTKQEIKQIAYEMFIQRGPFHVTVDEIIGEMGISKKTFYKVYSTKDELINEVCQDWIFKLKNKVVIIISQDWNVMVKYLEIQKCYLVALKELSVVFVRELKKYYPFLLAEFKQIEKTHLEKPCILLLEEAYSLHWVNEELDVEVFCRCQLYALGKLVFSFDEIELIDLYRQYVVNNFRGIINTSHLEAFGILSELSVQNIKSHETQR